MVGCCAKDLFARTNMSAYFPFPNLPQPPLVHLIVPPLRTLQTGPRARLTGNTIGTPPLTALLPSIFAFSLTHSFSSPFASFQLMIVAPNSSTSMLSPVGSTAETRLLECEIVTCACGARPGVAERAEGFFGRSTMLEIVNELLVRVLEGVG